MNGHKLRQKILLVFTVVGVLITVLAAVSVGCVRNVAAKYEETIGMKCGTLIMADEMKRNAEAAEKYILSAITCEDEDMADNYLNMAQAELDAMQDGYNYIKEKGGTDRELLDKIGDFIFTPNQARETMFSSIRGGNYKIAKNMFYSEYSPCLREVNGYLDTLRVSARSSLEVSQKQAEISYFGGKRLCMILCLMCLSVIAFFGLYLDRIVRRVSKLSDRLSRATRRMTEPAENIPVSDEIMLADIMAAQGIVPAPESEPEGLPVELPPEPSVSMADIIINDAARCINEIADGNDPVPEADYSGDYSFVLSAVRKMKAYLRGIMMQITRAAEYLAAEAERVAGISGELSEGAREQTDSISALSAAAEDIGGLLTRCEFIEKSIGNACGTADKQLDGSLRKLGEAGAAAAQACAVSGELEMIVKATEDIASRANVFAARAAITAAKAGASGRGFAAAADEARVLAMKSSEVSSAAAGVIGRFTEASVKSGQASAEAIEAVRELQGFTGDILSAAAAMEEIYGKISAALEEIKADRDKLSGFIRTGAVASEKCAASERTLSEQTDILRHVAERKPADVTLMS